MSFEVWLTSSLRGRRSRNKVSVGEPAEGSFTHCVFTTDNFCELSNVNSCHGAAFGLCLVFVRGLGRGARLLGGGKLALLPAGNP